MIITILESFSFTVAYAVLMLITGAFVHMVRTQYLETGLSTSERWWMTLGAAIILLFWYLFFDMIVYVYG